MANTTENKYMGEHSGILKFNEEERYCYILMDDGKEIRTTPMFDFFNGFITIIELSKRADDHYSDEEIMWFAEKWDAHANGELSTKEFFDSAKEKFRF